MQSKENAREYKDRHDVCEESRAQQRGDWESRGNDSCVQRKHPTLEIEAGSHFCQANHGPLILLLTAMTSPLHCLLCQLHSFASGAPFIGPGEGKEWGKNKEVDSLLLNS